MPGHHRNGSFARELASRRANYPSLIPGLFSLSAGHSFHRQRSRNGFVTGAATIYNGGMSRRILFALCVVAATLGLVLSPLANAQQHNINRGRKFKAPPDTARIEVTVVRDVNGKPIENAAVIFHTLESGRDKGNMELKTNEDGKAIIDVLPIGGTVRLQIIAKGFQTFGDDYKIDKAQIVIGVRMKRPGEQYSIYKDHPEASRGGKSPDASQPAPQPDSQPAPSQPQPK